MLANPSLKKILVTTGFKIKFLVHPVFSEYKKLFQEMQNEYIQVFSANEIRYADLFNECAICITDYSSIHFDVAILKKPILYYQFDKKRFFEEHYALGYFDYDKDGFGEVIEDESELVAAIDGYICRGCTIKDKYKKKIEDTFINIDQHNSARVFRALVKLDKKRELNFRFNNVH